MTNTVVHHDFLRELLNEGHAVPVRYRGTSMHPTFRAGDQLVVKSARELPVGVGSVVVYEDEDGLVTHRVIGRQCRDGVNGFVVRADAFTEKDPFLPPERLIGVVVARVRDGRTQRMDSRAARTADYLKTWILPLKVWVREWLKK